MTALTLDFTAVADINPYVFPAGWTVINDSFKVQTNALRSVFSDSGQSIVITDNPATTGLLDVSFTVLQASTVFNDSSGAVFCNSAGNGYAVDIRDTHIYIKPIVAKAIGASIANAIVAYVSGAAFRATYDLDTNTIDVYQLSVSAVTPALTASSLTPQAGMAGGLEVLWENNNSAGLITASVDGFASTETIDTVTTGGSPGFVVGQPFTYTETGLGAVTGFSVFTPSTPAATTAAINLTPGAAQLKYWEDGQYYPFAGTVTAQGTDGTLTATGSFSLSIPADQVDVIFNSIETIDNTYLGTALLAIGHPLANGDKGYYPPAGGLVISPNSGVSSAIGATTFVLWIHKISGILERYDVIINDAGEITDVTGITSHGITSRSVTSRVVTSRGI